MYIQRGVSPGNPSQCVPTTPSIKDTVQGWASYYKEIHVHNYMYILSRQARFTVASCFLYKVIRDLESIDHLCINPIHRIGLIHKCSFDTR